jgi:hypothetical protein
LNEVQSLSRLRHQEARQVCNVAGHTPSLVRGERPG